MRKAVAATAVLLALVVITSGSATLAAARALPGEQPVSPGIPTNIAPPPPSRSAVAHGRGLHGLLPVENKSGPGLSCRTFDKNSSCPPPPHR
ncbi:hypothetical protein HU200_017459 [Digitaria exilis]|uniref:Uncharacterized protein n=1 Tax=Digitaria exilis TaxID=1010633 RepID=A0A835KH53_9POAL|nr:hypothetical protein HU200_017459 [Digitaria exilis]